MRTRRARRRTGLLAATGLLALLVALGARAAGVLDALERDTVDARFAVRGERVARDDIVTVELDGRTLGALGLRPPLPRSMHARVMDRLRRDGARLIAYDFQFIGPTEPREDRALIAAIRSARPVLATHDVDGPPLAVPIDARSAARAGARTATVGLLADPDAKVRRVAYGGRQSRSFAVEAAAAVASRPLPERDFPAWIDYRGPPGTVPTYSFVDVMRGTVPAARFRGKIVVVGASDPILKDVFATPASDVPMPGAEIHAASIATILDGLPLRSAPAVADVLVLVALALLAPVLSLGFGALKVLAGALAALAAFVAGLQVAFAAGTVMEATYPVVGLLLSAAGSAVVELRTTVRERERLRRNFARFVPAAVVDDVMSRTDGDLRLGGVTIDATVLFCDLRGFTRWAEAVPAATVIEALNRYLSEMSEAILAHGGTVVSYMGDGIMAVFGAPLEQPDHADRALAAAREMVGVRLPRFNAWLATSGLGEGFRIGLGLNSGPVSSGNVGSEERLEYAAVGDTTNVAARLEAHCPETEFQLLVSEATRALLRDGGDGLIGAGEIVLRGRQVATRLWSDERAR